jgi:hypothetical protein
MLGHPPVRDLHIRCRILGLAEQVPFVEEAAGVAVGPSLPMDDLAALPVTLSVDGDAVESGTGAAASGHPAARMIWLAEQLATRALAGGR